VVRLDALRETAHKAVVLREGLESMAADAAVAWMRDLVRDPDAVVALARALDGLAYDRRAQLYATAKDADALEVAALLFEVPRPAPLPIEDRRTLTLGERKSLARGARREVLARLLADADVQVIEILLGNPRITERDVVAIAARRPVRGDVIRAVFGSRWVTRYAVKLAIAHNPHAPLDVALRLVAGLAAADLRRVATDPNIAEALRQQARRLMSSSR
jgi:hypothetical protein